MHTIYLDFAKAFDKVDHVILLKKLEAYGIRGKILQWLNTFLTNRSQRVRIGNHLSEEVKVMSGVPQGSVLGPLLFIIFMIDFTDGAQHVNIASFADDAKNWNKTTLPVNFFQAELCRQYKWAKRNNAEFNGPKFVKITMGDPDDTTPFITPSGGIIRSEKHVKDLGVYMSADVTFDYHINSIVKGAQVMSAWVLRTFDSRAVGPMMTLLKSLVRSKVEYASILWSPTDIGNIRKLENIQRRFTSKFSMFRRYNDDRGYTECYVDYWERLKRLKLYSLERRRERYMIMYMYNIHLGLVPGIGFLSSGNIRTGTTYHPKTNKEATKPAQTLRHSSFFVQGPALYNKLPADLRAPVNQSLPLEDKKKMKEEFKKRVDKWLELIPDEPYTEGANHRAAGDNSIVGQLHHHGREVARKWEDVRKQLDKEQADRLLRQPANLLTPSNRGAQLRGANRWKTASFKSRWDGGSN